VSKDHAFYTSPQRAKIVLLEKPLPLLKACRSCLPGGAQAGANGRKCFEKLHKKHIFVIHSKKHPGLKLQLFDPEHFRMQK
jgi:hypothetical protein